MTTIDIPKLLEQLQEVSEQPYVAVAPETTTHLYSLCKQSAAAIQELQQEQRRIITNVGVAFERVGKALQQHG